MLIGSHISLDDILAETQRVYNSGGNVIQLFIDFKRISEYKKLRSMLKKLNMKCVVHISYSIVCVHDWNIYSWWIRQLIEEIKIASMLKAFGIVLHIGSVKTDSIEEVSLNNLYESLMYVADKTDKNVKILLETPSGQGKELCDNVECLVKLIKRFPSERFGLCVDTCHIFVAGYDIRANPIEYFNNLEKTIGLEYIKLVHLNDSYNDINTKIDRHENIGEGYIGKDSLIKIVQFCAQYNIPVIIETKNRYKDVKIVLSLLNDKNNTKM